MSETVSLVQFTTSANTPAVGRVDGDRIEQLAGFASTYDLVQRALAENVPLLDFAAAAPIAAAHAYDTLIERGALLPPLTHPDPARLLLSGTGLTHLGSAATRAAMHADKAGKPAAKTDSMAMFEAGMAGGKPAPGEIGFEAEWFYKGDGTWLVAPGAPLELPPFAADGGEEPELAAHYLIDAEGIPRRIGFALGNEFSDHVRERRNYLLLSHSKLMTSSVGPELRLGPLPEAIDGQSRIVRNGETLWQRPFATGPANMSHAIENLEHHHFKYARFRRPGDVHIHFLGTATLSFADQIAPRPGDRFEISAEGFGRPLVNPLVAGDPVGPAVRPA